MIKVKYIVNLNGKPISEATPEELNKLDQAIAKAAKDIFGLIIPLDDTKHPRSEREPSSAKTSVTTIANE